MRSIAEVMAGGADASDDSIPPLAKIDALRRRFKAERAALYGWPPGASCGRCGDRGFEPSPVNGDGRWEWTDEPCVCGRGRRIAEGRDREDAWRRVVPARMVDFGLGGSPDQAAAARVRAWLDAAPWETGRNLALVGEVGGGKTGLAVAALREAFFRGLPCRFVSTPRWLDTQRPSDGPDEGEPADEMRRARRATLLALDDLGAERATAFAVERLYVLVNERWSEQRPTVVTTNRSQREIADALGGRIARRLFEGADEVVVAPRGRRTA